MHRIPDSHEPVFQLSVPAPPRRRVGATLVRIGITAILWVPRILAGLGLLALVLAAGWSVWVMLSLVLAALGVSWNGVLRAVPAMPAGMSSRTAHVIRDIQGEVVAVIGSESVFVSHPTQGIQQYRAYDNIQLVCGSVYNPAMSMGKDPTLLLAVCEECRAPHRPGQEPRHGLCSRAAGSVCAGCGRFLCPRDAISDDDGGVRCYRCSRRHRVKTAFVSLFFKREEG